jgi:hypothetical protein
MEEKKRGGNEERRGVGGFAGSGDIGVEGVDGERVRVRLYGVGDCVVTFTGTKNEERDNEFEIHRGEH